MQVGSYVSVVEEANDQELIKRVEEIQIPISVIWEQVLKHGLVTTNHGDCKDYISDPERCARSKNCIQHLIDQGTIQVGRPIIEEQEVVMLEILYPAPEVKIPVTPLVIQMLVPFPYESTQAIPWRYEPYV